MTLFITGTHTNIGKSIVTGHIAKTLQEAGHSVVTQKWIQTGCQDFPEDLNTHFNIMGVTRESFGDYHAAMCSYCLKLPASPHLAAQQEGITINPAKLTTATQALQRHFDHVLIEGAGGIMVPITPSLTLLDLVGQMKLPTLVVVKNELGCINHALLTINALAERQIPILGIVMNGEEAGTPRDILDDNPAIIASLSGLPILATIGQLENPITDTPDLSKVLSVLV